MAGHPADVGGAPVDVAFVVVEDIVVGHRGVDEVAAGRVQHALRGSGRTRSVEDEQRVLRVHRLGRAVRGDHLYRLVQPDVAALAPLNVAPGVLDDDDGLDAVRLVERDVDVGLERHLAAAAQALVRGDDDFRLGVGDAPGESVGREAAEHHRVDGADARAGEHRVSSLGDHRQIDGDPIALLDAVAFQHIGEMADLIGELRIGDELRLARIVGLPDDRGLVGALGQMAVDAIVRDVGDAVWIPSNRNVMRVVGGFLDLGVGLEPVDALAHLAPKAVGIGDRAGVHLLVFGLVDICAIRPCGGNVIHLFGHLESPGPLPRRAPSSAHFSLRALCPNAGAADKPPAGHALVVGRRTRV